MLIKSEVYPELVKKTSFECGITTIIAEAKDDAVQFIMDKQGIQFKIAHTFSNKEFREFVYVLKDMCDSGGEPQIITTDTEEF